MTTEDAANPVVLEGLAAQVTDPPALAKMLAWENSKYQTDYSIETLDPASNSCFRVTPNWVLGIQEGDFTGSLTRWKF